MTNKPMLSVEREFNREDRYIVVKRSDLDRIPNRKVVHTFLAALGEVSAHSVRISQRDFLVIESDWPEFEPAYRMIEDRTTGKPAAHQGKLAGYVSPAGLAGAKSGKTAMFRSCVVGVYTIPLYAEQPTAAVLPERSSQEYAIEHAEYMAQSVDDVLARFQAYGLALLAVDEGGDEVESELFEAIDTARSDLQESLVDLRSMVYEFRKRSNRCTSL